VDLFSDPTKATTLHMWATIGWLVASIPICLFLAESIPFLVFISVYAVVTGHWAAWQAGKTEIRQEKQEERQTEAIEDRCPSCGHDLQHP
jgi:hypothetical protein